MNMKRWILPTLVVCLFVSAAYGQAAKTTTVTFYHTSDLHEHSKPLPQIARFVAEEKKEDSNVLFLDTGDWCNKGDLTPLNTRGEAIVEMMAASKYDAVIAGNHDFSFGAKRLAELVDKYSTPLLAANCEWAEKIKPRNVAPYKILKLDGVTVGIIGTAPPFTGDEKGPSVKILPIARAVLPRIAELTDKVDIIVLMTHIGPPEDRKLARALPRVDVIFGGHHHHRFSKLNYDKPTQTVIQHSGAFGGHLGKVVLTWDGSKIVARKAELIKVTPDMPRDKTVQAVADKYLGKAAEASAGPVPSDRPNGHGSCQTGSGRCRCLSPETACFDGPPAWMSGQIAVTSVHERLVGPAQRDLDKLGPSEGGE